MGKGNKLSISWGKQLPYFLIVLLNISFFTACPNNTNNNDGGIVPYVPVTSITGVPTIGVRNIAINLTGTVNPSNATNKTIVWSIKNNGDTASSLNGNKLTATANGTVTVTATIANGTAQGTDYTQDFIITIQDNDQGFIPVTNITGVITSASIYSPNTLSGTVTPSNASYKTIVWSVKNAGTTGALISGNSLTVSAAGTVIVTATIANGTALGANYTKDFTISVSTVFNPVTDITRVPNRAYAGTPLELYGTVSPSNASVKNIIWTVKDAVYGVAIEGNIMHTTYPGTVIVTAAIPDAISPGEDFVKDFTITVYGAFVPVTGISNVSLYGKAEVDYPLSGTVNPSDATNKYIIWSVSDAGTTGAKISVNTLRFTSAGIATIRATINSGLSPYDGIAQGEPYVEDFIINVDPAFVAVTSITGVPTTAYVGKPLTLTGTVNPSNANNKTITWNIQSGGGTGAYLTTSGSNRILNTTNAGTVVVTATITNGATQSTPFTQNFPINVISTPPVINLTIENFTQIDEGEGVFNNVPPLVLSKSAKESQAIEANNLNNVVWYLGNINLGTGNSITLNAANFNTGSYTINISFSQNGKFWLSRIPFTVTE